MKSAFRLRSGLIVYIVAMMKYFVSIFGAGALFASVADAHASDQFLVASDACFTTGQRLAAERGAQLVSSTAENSNGKQVCKVVILTRSSENARPRRETLIVER